tara:strand:+ start:22 stop:207 length:186 start_codon:yes stop_codon:yes gene_type:complete
MEVNLASQAHNVPQVGFPQSEPVITERHVKSNPIGAILLFIKLKILILKIKFSADNIAIDE